MSAYVVAPPEEAHARRPHSTPAAARARARAVDRVGDDSEFLGAVLQRAVTWNC